MKKYLQNIPNSAFLVTGECGFIGSSICETLLTSGHAVRCLDNFSTGFKHNIQPFINNLAFTLIEGDIRDIDTCTKAYTGLTMYYTKRLGEAFPAV